MTNPSASVEQEWGPLKDWIAKKREYVGDQSCACNECRAILLCAKEVEAMLPLLARKLEEVKRSERLDEARKAYWQWKSSHEDCGGVLAERIAELEKQP